MKCRGWCTVPHETRFKVRFYEVDSYQVVWHGHYISWFEVGRNELASQFGLDPEQLKEIGLMAPVIDLSCKFKRPARYGDVVVVQTTTERCETAKMIFHYGVLRDNEMLAEGSTVHVLTDLTGTLLYRVPPELQQRLEQMFTSLGL
ncbi:MAG: acyl-CoA thioesterase [Deltaproteobacteria bacterium]|nr:acyl-CoA thioesterase [Deltaproteobacteria bacterium]